MFPGTASVPTALARRSPEVQAKLLKNMDSIFCIGPDGPASTNSSHLLNAWEWQTWCFSARAWSRRERSVLIYLTAAFWGELRRAIILDVSRYCLVKEMAIYIESHFSNLRAEDWCCSDQKRSYLAREWPFYEFSLEWLNRGGDFWYK